MWRQNESADAAMHADRVEAILDVYFKDTPNRSRRLQIIEITEAAVNVACALVATELEGRNGMYIAGRMHSIIHAATILRISAMFTRIKKLYIYIYIHTYTCIIYSFIYFQFYICTYIYIYIYMCINLSIYLSVGQPINQSVYLFTYLLIYLCIYVFMYLFIHLSSYLPTYLSVYLSIYLSV